MNYIIATSILLLLFLLIFGFKNKDMFTDSIEEIKTGHKCEDSSLNKDMKINKDGEFLTVNQAVDRAIKINRISDGESYEGIFRTENGDFYFCKNCVQTHSEGNVLLLKSALDGSIELSSNVGIKQEPLSDFLVNNNGTLLVKDKFCTSKSDTKKICITGDDIKRIKHMPVNVPREKQFCLYKRNDDGSVEQGCVEKKHFDLITGSAMANFRHMDHLKPKYGNAYAKYIPMESHPGHMNFRYWRGTNGFKKNQNMGRHQGQVYTNRLSLLEANTSSMNRAKFGFDVDRPASDREVVAVQELTSGRS